MAFIEVLDAGRLPEGALCQITVSGRAIALCHAGDGVHALSGECPHAGGPIGQGALHGHMIVCPWHAWEFDCRTGACDFNSSRLDKFPAKIADGKIWISLEVDA